MAKVIAADSLEAVLDELGKETKKIMDHPPENDKERFAFVLFFNTLKGMADQVFQYLPEGERKLMLDLCAAWMDAGLLLGRAPSVLADILKRTGANIEEQEG